jgi:hypothetical protein
VIRKFGISIDLHGNQLRLNVLIHTKEIRGIVGALYRSQTVQIRTESSLDNVFAFDIQGG